jgi:hypothetical protein
MSNEGPIASGQSTFGVTVEVRHRKVKVAAPYEKQWSPNRICERFELEVRRCQMHITGQ